MARCGRLSYFILQDQRREADATPTGSACVCKSEPGQCVKFAGHPHRTHAWMRELRLPALTLAPMASVPRLSRTADTALPRLLAAHLTAARSALSEWNRHTDSPQVLHAARVALRRLRSLLKSFRRPWLEDVAKRRSLDELGGIADATNPTRDADVHRAWLEAWLKEHPSAPARVRSAMEALLAQMPHADDRRDRPDITALSRSLRKIDRKLREKLADPGVSSREPLGQALASALRSQAARLEHQSAQTGVKATAHAAAHEVRLTAKRLRYLLEPFERQAPTASRARVELVQLQDALGRWRDLEVLGDFVVAQGARHGAEDGQDLLCSVLKRSPRTRDGRSRLESLTLAAREVAKAHRSAWSAYERRWTKEKFENLQRLLERVAQEFEAASGIEPASARPKRRRSPGVRRAAAAEKSVPVIEITEAGRGGVVSEAPLVGQPL